MRGVIKMINYKYKYKCNAYDKDNIPRVWAMGETKHEAKEQCKQALTEYLDEKHKRGFSYSMNRFPFKFKIIELG